jgi:hypothetical protein
MHHLGVTGGWAGTYADQVTAMITYSRRVTDDAT